MTQICDLAAFYAIKAGDVISFEDEIEINNNGFTNKDDENVVEIVNKANIRLNPGEYTDYIYKEKFRLKVIGVNELEDCMGMFERDKICVVLLNKTPVLFNTFVYQPGEKFMISLYFNPDPVRLFEVGEEYEKYDWIKGDVTVLWYVERRNINLYVE